MHVWGAMLFVALQAEAPSPPGAPIFEWEAPAGCPTAREVLLDLEHLVGTSLDEGLSEVRASVRVTAAEDRTFAAELTIASSSGAQTRQLQAGSCEDVAAAAVVLVAVAIESRPGSEAPPQATAGSTEPAGVPRQGPAVLPVPAPPTRADTGASTRTFGPPSGGAGGPRATLALTGGVGIGALPAATAAFGGRIGVSWGIARLDASAQYWLSRRESVRADAGVEFGFWSLGLRGCGVPSVPWVEFPLCIAVHGGALRGEPVGVLDPRPRRQAWVDLGGVFGILVRPLDWLGVGFDLALRVPLNRPRFVVEGAGLVHRPSPVGFDGAVVIEVRPRSGVRSRKIADSRGRPPRTRGYP